MLRFLDIHFEEAQGEALGYEGKKKTWTWESALVEHGWCLCLGGGFGATQHRWMQGSIGVLVLFAVKS